MLRNKEIPPRGADSRFTEDTLHRFIDLPFTMLLIQTIAVQCWKVEGWIGNRCTFMVMSIINTAGCFENMSRRSSFSPSLLEVTLLLVLFLTLSQDNDKVFILFNFLPVWL